MKSEKVTREQIKESLLQQLRAKGADTYFYRDLVEKYMVLWDNVEEMMEDIRVRGRRYVSISVSGKEFEKDNMSMKMVPQYLKQMQSLLSDMGISPDKIVQEGADDDAL